MHFRSLFSSSAGRWLRLVPVLFLTTPLLAQRESPDYAVTLTGDTLRGIIREKSNTTIGFRSYLKDEEITYDVDQVKGYSMGNVPRVSAEWVSDTLTGATRRTFLRLFTSGYLSLYGLSRSEGNFHDNLTYFLRWPSRKFEPMYGKSAWNLLKNKLLECENVRFLDLLAANRFSNTLPYYQQIVGAYNRCVRPAERVTRRRSTVGWSVGLAAGASYNAWSKGIEGPILFANSNGPYSTNVFPLLSPRVSLLLGRRAVVQLEAYYNRYQGEKMAVYLDGSGETRRTHFKVEEAYLAFPISFAYFLTDRSLRCYLKGGMLPAPRALSLRGWRTRDPGTPGAFVEELPYPSGPDIGFLVGWGVETRLKSGVRPFLELRGTYHSTHSSSVWVLGKGKSVQVVAGLTLFGSKHP
jgi:hypothetical protein